MRSVPPGKRHTSGQAGPPKTSPPKTRPPGTSPPETAVPETESAGHPSSSEASDHAAAAAEPAEGAEPLPHSPAAGDPGSGKRSRSGGAEARPATIVDVARVARVSVATVSRALSGGYCSPQTRERVLQAVEEVGYFPNRLARALVRRLSPTIGLVLPDIANPFFPALTRGVEDRASEFGFTVLLVNTDGDPARERRAVRSLLEHRVGGVILVTAQRGQRVVSDILAQGVPLVVMDRRAGAENVSTVTVDNVEGARLAVDHLLDLGHRRIAFIGGVPGAATAAGRLQGYRLALRSRGILLDPSLVAVGHFQYDGGYKAMRALLAHRPTAVFAANDLMALGAIKAAREAGMEVPQDVSVVGFDDIPMAEMAHPPLTTVRQPAYEMGREAARLLVEFVRGTGGSPRDVVLPAELVIRRSTAPPQRRALTDGAS